MTDNRTDSQHTAASDQGDSVKSAQDTTTSSTTQTIAPRHASDEREVKGAQSKKSASAEPQIKKVDITIAGATYPIFCPAHEEEELRSAVYHINEFAIALKKESPRLSQENLLVLCCLNLYEKIHNTQKQDNERLEQSKQTEALLSKIMKDAQSIL